MDQKQQENLESLILDVTATSMIVIDHGSETIKVGFAGEDQPRLKIQTTNGILLQKEDQDQGIGNKQFLFGKQLSKFIENYNKQSEEEYELSFNTLVNNGKVNYDDKNSLKSLYEYIFLSQDGLQINELTSSNLLIIDNPINTQEYKQKFAQIIFEELKVQSLMFMDSSVLSLLSTGQTTGLSIEVGHQITSVTPIFEGYPIRHACHQMELGGKHISEQLSKQLLDDGILQNKFQFEIQYFDLIQQIKENKLHIAEDYDSFTKQLDPFTEEEKYFKLPDQNIIKLSKEHKIKSPEILFNPKLFNINQQSLVEALEDTFTRCDFDLQNEIINCIQLSGGTSLMSGFPERIKKELSKIISTKIKIEDLDIKQESIRQFSAWLGGSMVGSLSTFKNLAIQRSDFEENQELKDSIISKRTI